MKERILRFWGIIRPRETNAFIWLALIVGLALVIRVVWVLVSQTTPVNEASVYDRLAWSLASDFELLPRKFFYLWASDADWVTFARAINMSVFQDQFQHGIPALKWFTQLYWAAIALMAAGAVLARPLRYWLSFPANLFPVLVVYWTMFHMAFFGTGRFHSQVIPVIVVLAVHLLSKDRDWLAWVRPFQHRNRSRAENGVDFT